MRRPVESGQYTSIRFTEHLALEGIRPSIGSVGDAYDNALAETTVGLYKTEQINRRGPWRNLDHVEIATLEWVDWYNHRRPHEAIDDFTPVAVEALHYAHITALAGVRGLWCQRSETHQVVEMGGAHDGLADGGGPRFGVTSVVRSERASLRSGGRG